MRTLVTAQAEVHDVTLGLVLDSEWEGREHPFVHSLQARGLVTSVIHLPPRAYVRERHWVQALHDRVRPDVAHTHGARATVLHGSAARRLGVPSVSTVHGFTGGGPKNRLYEWLQRRSLRRYDAVVAVSRSIGQVLEASGVRRDRVHVVPNAWFPRETRLTRDEARRVLGVPGQGFRIGWVGRMSHEKGVDVLLRALALLGDLPWTLSLVGDGARRNELRALARRLSLDSRVTWHGPMPGAERLYAAFDAFVLPSHTEGTPIVLFEAMAAYVPIVATSVGGVPDMLGSGEALLVPPNDPRALAEGIRSVMTEPGRAAQFARRAAIRLETAFAIEPWLAAYTDVYEKARACRVQ